MTMNKQKGFTVVELIVIVIVIAILVSITAVSYMFARDDAMDAKIKSTVKTAGDALSLYESDNKSRVSAQGNYFNANGMDTLVPKYLKPDYRDGITSKNATDWRGIMRWYNCLDGNGGFVVYAALNNPTESDISSFNKIRSGCAHNDTQAPTSGSFKFNYAQLF